MNDRELLELAAKAAGDVSFDGFTFMQHSRYSRNVWCPLQSDGDALRLAVKLGLCIDNEQERSGVVTVSWGCDAAGEHLGSVEENAPEGGDDYLAARLAIVRAAAEIGKAMP
jgi:hypothetical protein